MGLVELDLPIGCGLQDAKRQSQPPHHFLSLRSTRWLLAYLTFPFSNMPLGAFILIPSLTFLQATVPKGLPPW